MLCKSVSNRCTWASADALVYVSQFLHAFRCCVPVAGVRVQASLNWQRTLALAVPHLEQHLHLHHLLLHPQVSKWSVIMHVQHRAADCMDFERQEQSQMLQTTTQRTIIKVTVCEHVCTRVLGEHARMMRPSLHV